MHPEQEPPLDSPLLGSEEVRLLLLAVAFHRDWLQTAYLDALRLARTSLLPCYLVDHSLLDAFLDENSDEDAVRIQAEMEYLVSRDDIPIFIGAGTLVSIIRTIRTVTGVDLAAACAAWPESRTVPELTDLWGRSDSAGNAQEAEFRALRRVSQLLDLPNLHDVAEIASALPEQGVHQETFDQCAAQLRHIRPYAPDANLSHALNCAQTLGLRLAAAAGGFPYYPYLLVGSRTFVGQLTITAPDDVAERAGYSPSLHCLPSGAVYSTMLRSLYPIGDDAEVAAVDLMYRASLAEYELRRSEAYHKHVRGNAKGIMAPSPADATELLQRYVTRDSSLKALTDLLSSPLIAEAQRLFDNTRHAVRYQTRAGTVESDLESPSRLFDLLYSQSRISLGADDATSMAQLWSTAISVEVLRRPGYSSRQYSLGGSQGQSKHYLLRIEQHRQGYTVVRWPTLATAEQLLRVFSIVLERRGVKQILLHIGTRSNMVALTCELPLSLDRILAELTTSPDWVRIESPRFALYADFAAEPMVGPAVGVISDVIATEEVRELYQVTSARFIFPSWLDRILADINLSSQESHAVDDRL